ncbi:MAG: 1-deoxy-D-xylulose-5-phosphate reductoisomerase [Clostridia bacterium]|nr:1-deoxy-D-xylulose-5-phosphate reductoisomerase [Clostridia bacterium]
MDKRTIAILGATGSIGTQALDIVARYPDRFDAVCLTAHSASEKLFDLVRRFRPRCAALVQAPEHVPADVRFCQWYFGTNATVDALLASGAQDALCAIVGIAGLNAVWAALDVCERVLLANKEALVTGGDLVMAKASDKGIPMLPVDSEHSAIFQCLQARQGNPVRRLLLTASGGALRDWQKADMYRATVRDVLAHPTWRMGGKITVDCASMVNKGLEIIEAHHLFSMPAERIDVVVHPQSVIHSMIEFEDGAVLAQLGMPDMRGPIGYAMGYPERLPYDAMPVDFFALGHLDFLAPDPERFPALGLAIQALKAGGSAPVVLNGANEAAVDAFLHEQIPFGRIPEIIDAALQTVPRQEITGIADVYAVDTAARAAAASDIRRHI